MMQNGHITRQYAMLICFNASLWLCSMIMLHLHAYVDIMLVHYSCIIFYYGSAYCIQVYPDNNKLEQLLAESWCHQIELTSATTFAFYGKALMRSIVMPLAGAYNDRRLWARATLIR